jgi:D-alanine-D-alanine ligase-like ATP-grasp enzyme
MKICVLQPDFSYSDVDIGNYHPRRDLAPLWPDAKMDNLFLDKRTVYAQLKEAAKKNYDVFVNLCEGYLEWDVPSIDVIHALEMLNLPYTGPTPELYDPSKEVMKYVAYGCGVATPAHRVINSIEQASDVVARLKFPLFVKPAKAGDSLGIDVSSRVEDLAALEKRVGAVIEQFGDALVEEYVAGREFTVLVAADPENPSKCLSFKPVEYKFGDVPFKTYAMKTSELHPGRNVPCDDLELEKGLREAAEKIFLSFSGKGFARMDFRVDDARNIWFLEVNFTCSVFYANGDDGSADVILDYDPIGRAGFLRHIVAEGIARHRRKQPLYEVRGDGVAGYGIYARATINKGEIIFQGEARPQRVVTRRYAADNPELFDPTVFRRYAYPVSDEVYLTWDESPAHWSPQNHSCEANCCYDGLNVVARRDVERGEELTLDYAKFLNEASEAFLCRCKAASCRQLIKGSLHNSVTSRENNLATAQTLIDRRNGSATGEKHPLNSL